MNRASSPAVPAVYRPARAVVQPAAVVRPPIAGRSTVVQRRTTYTGLKTEHATAVYKNHYKGDPPFKPQKGNFGKVSWFAGTGNAYVGGQTQSYTERVSVNVPDNIQKLDEHFFTSFKMKYVEKTGANLDDTLTHKAFWQALGDELVGYGMVEVAIPQCELSRQGKGTFITASAAHRLGVTLADPAKLRSDLVTLGVGMASVENTVDARNATNAPNFSVEFASVAPEKMGASRAEFIQKLLANVRGVGRPSGVAAATAAVPIPATATNPITRKFYEGRKKVTLTLTYADYKAARHQAKLWAMAASNPTIVNDYGGMTIVGGANWSAKATRAYTASY